MSLLDTIDAARQEVQEGGTVFAGRDKAANAADEKQDETTESASAPRRARGSAANAKPARDAASSVRVVSTSGSKNKSRSSVPSKPRSEMTKEERKAERAAERRAEDKRLAARTAVLNLNPEYQRSQKIWWILLGVGLGLTVLAFVINWLLTDQLAKQVGVTPLVVLSIAPLVLAYACIIIAVIYDLRVGRPIRKKAEADVQGMTVKRMNAVIREDAKREEAKKAEKEAKKAARRGAS